MTWLTLLHFLITRHASLFPLLAPLPLLATFFFPSTMLNQRGNRVRQVFFLLALGSLFFSMLSCVALALTRNPIHQNFISCGPCSLAIYFDTVTAVMLLLVSFLALAVITFSINYLDGNPRQGEFFKWLSVTSGSVQLLVVSGNLALFALTWAAVSLALHQLLLFYRERYGAKTAARKKYLFNRLGDLALIGALVAIWREFGTFDYVKLFSLASEGAVHSMVLGNLLLVVAALIKSAQFPFHGWLPDTMETPTPVSALMHAGIINAGGFLIIRLSPLIVLAPSALALLAAVGGLTAFFGSLVMITQTSVKRSLAFSTVAQMGFMMLQCGLGAFALALFHIVAHSLYKAYSFLASGSIIHEARMTGEPLKKRYLGIYGACSAIVIALILVLTIALTAGVVPWDNSARCCFSFILGIAIAQLLWHWWSISTGRIAFLEALIIVSLLSLLFFTLHSNIELLVKGCVPLVSDFKNLSSQSTVAGKDFFAPVFASSSTSCTLRVCASESPCLSSTTATLKTVSKMSWPISILTLVALFTLALRVFLPPVWVSTRIGRSLFVHIYNGFYINTIANRLIAACWPYTSRE